MSLKSRPDDRFGAELSPGYCQRELLALAAMTGSGSARVSMSITPFSNPVPYFLAAARGLTYSIRPPCR